MTECERCGWPLGPGEDYRKDGDTVCAICAEGEGE